MRPDADLGAPKGTRVGGVAVAHGARSAVGFTAMRTSPAGAGTLTASATEQRGSWLGDLSVSFPGRPDVRLADARFEGSVLKPGQCSVEGNVACVVFSRPGLSPGGG